MVDVLQRLAALVVMLMNIIIHARVLVEEQYQDNYLEWLKEVSVLTEGGDSYVSESYTTL